ncbi:MAG: hypothetical protein WD490_02945 [Opitutales bacterium]
MHPVEEDDDDYESEYDFVEEDENEISEDRARLLEGMHPVAAVVMGGLTVLFVIYFLIRGITGVMKYFQ